MRLVAVTTLMIMMFLTTSVPAGEAVEQVEIRDFTFIPAEITVKMGTTVRWINREKRQFHSVWFEAAGDPEPAYIFPDETTERSFDEPGTFSYRCGPHPEMRGSVTVIE
ncbi:MAG: plastocyanin [Proteobacteria bacterium]|nr:MAG: plastocyanin [Pseudomonadota bacterium]QKK11240.1 MAG: plastocyanin [Pseudomonadota bacterium]